MDIRLSLLESFYATWNWDAVRDRWGDTLQPYYLDWDHMRPIVGMALALVDRFDERLLSVHVAINGSRWLVLNIDGTCKGVHDRHALCEPCWTAHRRRVHEALHTLDRDGTVIYTGGNGVHVWIALATAADAYLFSRPGGRALLRDRLALPVLDAGAWVRVPGALHEHTGRVSHAIPRSMPWPPV